MAIPATYIQELVARNDIYDTISRYVSLQRAGRLYKGLCPFHSERSPSFMVYPETQSYYCFGCGAGGDVIKFTMEMNSLSYIEAIRFLAQQCGMPMPDEDDGQAKLKARILQMNKLAARFFYDTLNSEAGRNARKYLRDRQLSDKTIVNFGLGYAPAEWQGLTNYLRSKGFTDEEMVRGYLAARNKNGNLYDIFRDRVMFPIIDLRGNVIAFGGRRMGDEGGPKYLNSGDTPVFKKSNGLFALNLAKKSGKDSFILAEGYMDVIAMHQAGFNNAVATLGTALTSQQARLIGDYAKKVIISYDSDEAGQKATRRAMEIFEKEDVTVQVLQMTGAKDPDEYIKKYGAQRFEMLLEGANSALDFQLLKLKSQYDIQNAEQRVEYLTKACDVLAGLTNPIQQDVYCTRLANETSTDKASIKLQIDRARTKNRRKETKKKEQELLRSGVGRQIKVDYRQKGNTMPKAYAQQQIISALVRDNSLYSMVSQQLKPENFTDSDMRAAYTAFSQLIEQNIAVDYPTLKYHMPEDSAQALAGIIARNNEIIITGKDVQMHIENLLTAKLSQSEASEKTIDDLAQRIKSLKEKKK
ncbi:MAG: DNA primase [Oscillospiraceae bacterium]|nr:DNA primase [Oscillospiraceae bacterium]